MKPDQIRTARAAAHRARPRDFAETHGIPEAALVAAFVGPTVVRIDAAPDRLLPLVSALGEVLALTRNNSAVQERQGRYLSYVPGAAAHRVLGAEVELCLVPAHWVHAFAVTEATAKDTKRSIQVFDAMGDAVHKIHLTPESDVAAYEALVEVLRLPEQPDAVPLVARPAPDAAQADPAWAGPAASRSRVRRIAAGAVTQVLERASADRVDLVITVGNAGCSQVFSGPVGRIVPAGYWINVMDPGFNLHLRNDHLAEVWLVEAGTPPGVEMVVEAFDVSGGLILQIAGRKTDVDPNRWTALTLDLPAEGVA